MKRPLVLRKKWISSLIFCRDFLTLYLFYDKELGLESLQQRCWYRKLCLFFKVYKNQCSKYLFDVIPQSNCPYRTNIPHINVKHQFFKNSYFPSTIIEWNKLDSNIRNSETLNIFKSKILKFIRPTANSIFGCHNSIWAKATY